MLQSIGSTPTQHHPTAAQCDAPTPHTDPTMGGYADDELVTAPVPVMDQSYADIESEAAPSPCECATHGQKDTRPLQGRAPCPLEGHAVCGRLKLRSSWKRRRCYRLVPTFVPRLGRFPTATARGESWEVQSHGRCCCSSLGCRPVACTALCRTVTYPPPKKKKSGRVTKNRGKRK